MKTSKSLLDLYLHNPKTIYIGDIEILDNKFIWHRNKKIVISKIKDSIYFMMVNDVLYKIGKTESSSGWQGRVATYTRKHHDSTNKRILRIMEEDNLLKYKILIYVLPIDRVEIKTICPITNDVITDIVPMAGRMEKHVTKKFINEGYELKFCRQLN
jgi:hypothetical protein